MDRRSFLAASAAATVLPRFAFAQSWPTRSITILVAHGAGSSTDVVSRLVSEGLQPALGQSVIVEPKPGAGGNIATVQVKNAAPDGHTLLANSVSISVNPSLYNNAGYDVVADLCSIALGPRTPNIITVNPSMPVRTVAELIAHAKSTPGNYASSGTGTTTHLSMERLKRAAGFDLTHIAYTPARAVTDVVAGHVPIGSTSMPVAVPLVRDGKLRAIAVTSKQRSAALPEVPTLAELGYPQFDDYTWFGFFGPAAVPRSVQVRLNAEINKVLMSERVQVRFRELGFEIATMNLEDFAEFVAAEATKWHEVVVANNIKAEG